MNDFQKKLFHDGDLSRGDMPVVITSRIRLARNLQDFNFVKYASKIDLAQISDLCKDVLTSYPDIKNATVLNMSDLNEYQGKALVERHLCSPEFVVLNNESKLVFTNDHMTSVMINEEDHLRIQVFNNDLSFREMYEKINRLDDFISDHLAIAFDSSYGFLTSCPMNVGTGMRASVMLHLPALVAIKQMSNLILAVQKLGFVVRGMYGENSEAQGKFFQISNHQTLGLTEVDILSRLIQIIQSIIEYELNARELLKKEKKVQLYDTIGRAMGILSCSYAISSAEAINHLSFLILAADMGYLPKKLTGDLRRLLINTQDAHVQVAENTALKPEDCDIKRAEILRKFLADVPDLDFN